MSDRLNILAKGSATVFAVGGSVSGSSATLSVGSINNLTVGMKVIGTTPSTTNLKENTFIKSIDSSSQITLSKSTDGAISSRMFSFSQVNYDVPTNPHINLAKTLSSTDRMYAAIFSDDSNATLSFDEVGTTTANTERENLANTRGYRIKCFDTHTNTGVQLIDSTTNYTDSDFSTSHYFVLLHSDDHNLHHFAKLTQVTRDDVTGDSFEFEPRLGQEIPKGTKFMLFKGPLKSTNPLAISAGIKSNLQFELFCSRPLFYFFDEDLDKEEELDHGRKYYAYCQTTNTNGAIDLDAGLKTTFLTVTEYAEDIVDYSKYNLRAKVVDNLRPLDAPQTNTSNEGNTPNALDFTDYNDAFPNARRDTDDNHTSLQYRGPRRYLHYKFSPDKSNSVFGVFDNIVYESYGQRGGYSETKIIDVFKIQHKKIIENEGYRVRHKVHRADLEEFFDLNVEVLTDSSPTYTFTSEFDLNNFLNDDDEIKIGDTLFIIDSIGTHTAATGTTPATQTLTLKNAPNKLHKSDGVAGTFTSSSNPTISIGSKLFRRAFNRQDKTLMTDFNLVAGRHENLFINFISDDYSLLRANVTAIDVEKKLMTLAFTNKTYGVASDSGLQWLNGEYEIEIERFNGTIETIDFYQENGQRILEMSGRNNYSKLLSPVINRDTLHSKDIIYSSTSPYPLLIKVPDGDRNIVSTFGNKTVTITSGHGWTTGTESDGIGHHLFVYHSEHDTVAYVGKISAVPSSDTVTLENFPLAETSTLPDGGHDRAYYADSTKPHFVLNKALATNSFESTSTDLTAASNKGLFFESGQSLSSDGSESATLVGTSASSDARAIGYYISDTRNMKSDSNFQTRLDDNASTKVFSNFETINTLIDFTILGISDSDTGKKIEIAPYIPLTLGRVDINFANTQDTTFSNLGACTTGTSGNKFFTIDKDVDSSLLSTTTSPRKMHNKPIYANNIFIGKCISAILETDHDTINVFLDRKLSSTIDGQTISVLTETNYGETTKLTHELNIINGGHLHTAKIISLLNPHVSSDSINKTMALNYPLYYDDMANGEQDEEFTYSEKYGSPYYRIINIEKGNYNKINKTVTTDLDIIQEYYLEVPSKVPYYASSYRFNLGAFTNNVGIVGVGKSGFNDGGTHSSANHLLPESRGMTSVFGSRYFDTTIHKSDGEPTRVLFPLDPTDTSKFESPYIVKDHLDLLDHKVARMFLFANSDLLPYSSKRYDSLMYGSQTRDITNYNVFALEQPTLTSSSDIKEGISGKTNTITLNDSNYSTASIISADKTVSSLKRFSLMRLTEVVFDWAFNQIDPENIPKGDRVIPTFIYSGFHFNNLASLFAGDSVVVAADYQDYTVGSCEYSNSNRIDTTGTPCNVRVGMPVSGLGIPTGSTIISIIATSGTNVTAFRISQPTTGGFKTGQTLTFGSFIATDTSTSPASSPVAATGQITVFDHDANCGMTQGQFVTLVSTDGTSKNYVIVDDTTSSVTTGAVLTSSSDLGTITLSSVGLSAGVAVTLNTTGSVDNQQEFLTQLKAAIEHANGHNGKITVSSITAGSSDEKFITLTQATGGESGNTVITENVSNVQESGFFGGRNNLVSERNIIADSNGRYIGEVAAIEHSGSAGKIVLMDVARKTNGTNYYEGTLFSVRELRDSSNNRNSIRTTTITGHGKEGTFVALDREIQMLKSIVFNGLGPSHYGESGSSFHTKHSETVGATTNVSNSFRLANTFLPIVLDSDSALGQTEHYGTDGGTKVGIFGNHPSKILEYLDSIKGIGNAAAPTDKESLYSGFLPVFLNRFDVENGGGSTISRGTCGGPTTSISMRRDRGDSFSMVGMALLNDFAESIDGIGSHASRTYNDDADGVMVGFKPRLYLDRTNEVSDTSVGNRTVYYYPVVASTNISSVTYFDEDDGDNSVAFSNINRLCLDLMDLTGCYLVSEKGQFYDKNYTVNTESGGLANIPSLNEQTPSTIAYVISHEIDTSNDTETHILTLDTRLDSSAQFYRIMQPNHTCFYDFSPNEIRLNTLSSAYTKISGENSCYDPSDIKSYIVRNKSAGRSFDRFHNTGGREAALSMYLPIDLDAQSDSIYTVIRDCNDMESILTPNEEITMAISDGEDSYKSSIKYTDNGDDIGHYLRFDKIREMLGVVSISEPMTLEVVGDLSTESKRLMIGSVANICFEGDDLINDLLETNDIEFTSEESNFPYFLAPHYKSVDLFSAINLILSKKDKTLIEKPSTKTIYNPKESTFSLVNETSSSNFPKVLFDDDGEHQIFEYKEAKNLFDFYNEIIVYGNSHKGTRKDLRSVQKIGRKTLEVYEKELTSQEEVNKRAGDLLRIHSDDNIRLNITVGHTKISQLRAGDIVQVELDKEGIQLDDYIVLQIQHDLLGMMQLELGKFSKQLEDRFAELLSSNKKIFADIRSKKFNERSTSFDILDSIDIKVSKLLVRKVSSSGSATLGFGSALNTSTTPMGFSGGSTDTITDLVEEEF